MADREMVIQHFQDAIEASGNNNKWRFVRLDIIEKALALLKEQGAVEPIPPIDESDLWKLGKIDKPLNYMGYDVTTIEDPELGSFHYDKKHELIDWESADRLDELSVSVDMLKAFLHKAEEIFAILGVDVND